MYCFTKKLVGCMEIRFSGRKISDICGNDFIPCELKRSNLRLFFRRLFEDVTAMCPYLVYLDVKFDSYLVSQVTQFKLQYVLFFQSHLLYMVS